MSIIHVTGRGGAAATDRTPFYGHIIPPEISAMRKPLKQLDKAVFRKIIEVLALVMEGGEAKVDAFKDIPREKEEEVTLVYVGVYKLLQLAFRLPKSRLKQEHFKDDLIELKIPEEFIKDIGSVVFGSKCGAIEEVINAEKPSLPKLENFRWRVDVGISTSVLQRVLEPTVLMQMTLSDGNQHQMEVPISKFHELRHGVASVLRDMEQLEKRSILQIDS